MALVVAFSVILPSCEDEPEAMELPPMDAMVIDFSDFGTPADTASTAKSADSATYQNWFYSFTNVTFWSAFTSVTLAVPVAAYAVALEQTPVYMGDNTWEWQFTYTHGGGSFTAKLVGNRLNNEEFNMRMYITKSGPRGYSSFMWFEGTVRYDHTHATWTLYESPNNPVELLTVEWNKNYETGASDITYEVVKETSEYEGDFIEFAVMPEANYDAHYTITGQGSVVAIEWDSTTHAGRVMSMDWFQDELWHCWNEQLEDTDCPQ